MNQALLYQVQLFSLAHLKSIGKKVNKDKGLHASSHFSHSDRLSDNDLISCEYE
jgi:hypothetical protein